MNSKMTDTDAAMVLPLAHIIADCALFLDHGDGEAIDPDLAAQARARLAADIRAFDKPFLRELIDAFATIASEFRDEGAEMVRNIPHNFYLEEALVVDDPLSLHQLKAQRSAAGNGA